MKKNLAVYRRHTKSCIRAYPQNQRIYRPRTAKESKGDCDCPIVATGKLAKEVQRLQHFGLETNDWAIAVQRAAQWEEWQSLTDPSLSATAMAFPTVDEACTKFLSFHGPDLKEWGKTTLGKYRIMFDHRLKEFCDTNKIQHVHAFDEKNVVNAFVTSWRNKNPLKNRVPKPGEFVPSIPLAYTSKVKELERFRYFSEWCRDNGWLQHNHAKKIKLKLQRPVPKYGFEPAEQARVFAAISQIQDGQGGTDGFNAQQLFAFCLVSRYSGLRINAVANLDQTQLVKREEGEGHALLVMDQQKTGWVRIPVPNSVNEALTKLPFKGEVGGKRYWFRTGKGELSTAIKIWRARLTRLFKKAQDPDPETGKLRQPFNHAATPHTWRHSFSISHLNTGTEIKWVSRWLGHASIAVTESHYAHANKSTHNASDAAYDASLRRQDAVLAGVVVKPIAKRQKAMLLN